MESIPRKKTEKITKFQAVFCVLLNLLHLRIFLPFLFILLFFLFNVYIYFLFLSFLFVLYQATAHNNRNCSGGRKIEYKVVIYSRV